MARVRARSLLGQDPINIVASKLIILVKKAMEATPPQQANKLPPLAHA
jgi:hypothetical protein